MLLTFDDVLDRETVNRFRTELARARWVDGRASAGTMSVSVKANQQVDVTDRIGLRLGNEILQRLGSHAGFLSAALPEQILPPKFNRHADGGHYGSHVDGAIMVVPQTRRSLRTDLSATLFLSDPEDYEGGELLIETPFGAQSVKLPAGSLVLYPSTSLHQVTPVTQGIRIGAFFWIQSLVRDEGARALLHDLDQAIQRITPRLPEGHGDLLALTGIYHNLLRRWAVP